MKLKKVRLKNFRGYSDAEFSISSLCTIIGRNDVGKSTILDALDIYFNDAPIEYSDKYVYGNGNIEIICSFEIEQNEPIVLDKEVPTTLEEEHLLKKDGLLEISKVYECSSDKVKKPKVRIIANHPSIFEPPLICLKISDLKTKAQENKVDVHNKSVKKEIRKSIFVQMKSKLKFKSDLEINIDEKGDTDASTILDKLKTKFPSFLLFQADRTNTEKDREVNDTTKAIAKVAVQELQPQFTEIQEKVREQIQKLADETLSKMQLFDEDVAKSLRTNVEMKSLDSLFSFTFNSDDNIPLNKRGSGVRRLMLLSFFQAEADRKNTKRNRNVIYAIEEPETSQHPDYQKRLMENLKKLARSENHQVILTTHTPEMVKLVNRNELVYIQKDNNHNITVQTGDKIDISKVRDTLGILPFVVYKGVIFVEGGTDVAFFENLGKLERFKRIFDISKLTFIPLNGRSNIDTWIKEDYLANLNIKRVYFEDRDDRNESSKGSPDQNSKNEETRRTEKREIENYFSPELIERTFKEYKVKFSDDEKAKWNDLKIAETLIKEKGVKLKKSNIKGKLQGEGVWNDISFSNGAEEEITGWFKFFKEFFEDAE